MTGYSFAASYQEISWYSGSEGGETILSNSYYNDPATTHTIDILQPGLYLFQMDIFGYSLSARDWAVDGTIGIEKAGGASAASSAVWGPGQTTRSTLGYSFPLRIYAGPSGGTDAEIIDTVGVHPAPMSWFWIKDDANPSDFPFRIVPFLSVLQDGLSATLTTTLVLAITRLPFSELG